MKSPVDLLRCLFLDLKRNEPGVRCLERDLITLEFRFKHEGLSFVTKTLPALGDALDRGLADGWFRCPSNFKKKGALPLFLGGLLRKVFEASTGRLKDSPNTRIVKSLREILRVFKKATVSTHDEESLHRAAVQGFFECDASIPDTLPDRETHMLKLIAKVILKDLGNFDPSEIQPKHGPGTVAEKLTPNQKWMGVWDSVISGDLNDYGFDMYSCRFQPGPYMQTPVVRNSDSSYARSGIAKVLSVPKNSTSRRTITAEPLIRQYVQQGLNTVLRESISKCSVLSQCLSLTDQSKNQHLAMEGSRTGLWATIDLSSASDLLSRKLVDVVFGEHELFHEHMYRCRSPNATDGKNSVELRKFAGMGNALTFPVQSVVFATIAIAAILDYDGLYPTYGRIKRAARLVRVFGDDIIVPNSRACQVVTWLESLGLRVNRNKSFWTGLFRESCGVDAFMGVDVTPVYLKTSLDFLSTEPSDIASHISASNHCWNRGLYETAIYLQKQVEEALGRPLPLVRADSPSLGWHTRPNHSTISKWNGALQRFEFVGLQLRPVKRRDVVGGYAALLSSLTSLAMRGSRTGLSRGRRILFRNYIPGGSVFQETELPGDLFDVFSVGKPTSSLVDSAIRFRSRIVWRGMPSY